MGISTCCFFFKNTFKPDNMDHYFIFAFDLVNQTLVFQCDREVILKSTQYSLQPIVIYQIYLGLINRTSKCQGHFKKEGYGDLE